MELIPSSKCLWLWSPHFYLRGSSRLFFRHLRSQCPDSPPRDQSWCCDSLIGVPFVPKDLIPPRDTFYSRDPDWSWFPSLRCPLSSSRSCSYHRGTFLLEIPFLSLRQALARLTSLSLSSPTRTYIPWQDVGDVPSQRFDPNRSPFRISWIVAWCARTTCYVKQNMNFLPSSNSEFHDVDPLSWLGIILPRGSRATAPL